MAVYKQDIVDIELNSGNVHRSFLKHAIGSADAKADHFGIRTFRGGVPVDLSGVSVQGYFRNSQGTNIAITSGNIVDGNVAEVVLPQACYNYEGPFCLAIKLIGGGVTGTMRIVDGVVDNTNTGSAVAPTGSVPTYSEILSQYDAMVAATAAANGCTAETFDATKAYSAGKYVINSGALYRLTADHAANVTWANTSKVEVKFGNELSDVKSALTFNKEYIEKQISDNIYTDNVAYGGTVEVSGTGNYVFENIYEITDLTGVNNFSMKCDEITGATYTTQSMQIHFYHDDEDLVYVSGGTSVVSRDLSDYPTTNRVVFRLYPAAGTALPTGKATYKNLKIIKGSEEIIEYNGNIMDSSDRETIEAEIETLQKLTAVETNVVFDKKNIVVTGSGNYVQEIVFTTADIPEKYWHIEVGDVTGNTAINVVVVNGYDENNNRVENLGIEKNTIINRAVVASAVKYDFIFYPAQGTALPTQSATLDSLIVCNNEYAPYTRLKESLVDSTSVTEVAKKEIDTTADRIESYGKIEFMLLMVTDIHSGGRTYYKTINNLPYAQKTIGASIVTNLGDLGFDYNETAESAYTLMENYKEISHTDVPFLTIKGNHDYRADAGITQSIFNTFLESQRRVFPNRMHDTNNGYGLVTFGESDVKLIYLNTSEGDTQNYQMSQTQLRWLVSTLSSMESTDKVVIITHMCPYSIGRRTTNPTEADTNPFITLRNMLAAFVAKTSGSYWDVSWNFTGNSAKLVCILSGDSHFNNEGVIDGVNTIVRQGYGYSGSDAPQGSTYDDFDRYNIPNYDVLCVKTDGNAKIFRIGAGGSARDYAFTY